MDIEMKRKLVKKWTKQLRYAIQDVIDEELEKVVPRDDPKFMEMRKMTPIRFNFWGEKWKPSEEPYALCPPKWERDKDVRVGDKEDYDE